MKNLSIKKTIIACFFLLFFIILGFFSLFSAQISNKNDYYENSLPQEQNEKEKNSLQNENFKVSEKDENQALTREKSEDNVLKEKIGQMLVIGFRGLEIADESVIGNQIKNLNLGGVILFDYDNPSKSFPRNISNPKQVKNLISGLQSFSAVPLFVSIDAEGGSVNRLKAKYGFTGFPSAQSLGEKDNPKLTEETAQKLGEELKSLGFNLNFAPVADVNINPQNPVIGKLERSFSENPEKTAEQAIAFIKGMRKNNIISAIKHFPGHGSSQSDSHLGMVDVTKTYQQKELIPFQKITEQGYADMVMTAHIINSSVDPDYPATLSPFFLQNILRKQLGYKGIIISDDMQMGAIAKNYGLEEAIVKSINAGCDLLIFSNNNDFYDKDIAFKAAGIIFEAVKNGRIPKERISESYERIMELKKRFDIIKSE